MPPKIKRVLGQMAIEYVIAVKATTVVRTDVGTFVLDRNPAPPIAPPDLKRVLEAVRRRAPVGSKTLRRKRV